MAITRLQRRVKRRRMKSIAARKELKRLLRKPVVKGVNIEDLKKNFVSETVCDDVKSLSGKKDGKSTVKKTKNVVAKKSGNVRNESTVNDGDVKVGKSVKKVNEKKQKVKNS